MTGFLNVMQNDLRENRRNLGVRLVQWGACSLDKGSGDLSSGETSGAIKGCGQWQGPWHPRDENSLIVQQNLTFSR